MAKIIFCSGQTGNWGFVQSIKEQQIPEFEYWFLHDNHVEATDNKGWNYIDTSNFLTNKSHPKRNRFMKMMTYEFFSDFDYLIWLDCKFYVPKDFLQFCLKLIKEEEPNWLLSKHSYRTTMQQEIEHMKNKRDFTDSQINDAVKHLNPNLWFSIDGSWHIRKNNKKNKEIGQKWYELTDKCYPDNLGHVRDQFTFSSAIEDKNYLNLNFNHHHLYKYAIHMREKFYSSDL